MRLAPLGAMYEGPRAQPGPDRCQISRGLIEEGARAAGRCGCVIGRYRELATNRELTYIEEKGQACEMYGHRRNHTIAADRAALVPELTAVRAS